MLTEIHKLFRQSRTLFCLLLIYDLQLTQRGETITWQRGSDGKIRNVDNDNWVKTFRIEKRLNNPRGRGGFRGRRTRPY